MNLRVLRDHVAVKMDRVGDDIKTDSGLLFLLPPSEKKWSDEMKGEVIAVGPGKISKKGFLKPLEVKVGDRVRVQRIGARESWFQDENGNDIMICWEADILGVIKQETYNAR